MFFTSKFPSCNKDCQDSFDELSVQNMMDPSSKKTREYEYEIQFFGFTPDSFVNGGKLELAETKLNPRS